MQGAATRAKGDLDAAQIYAKAYVSDPQFYAFYRSLKAYERSFSQKSDILILKPKVSFLIIFTVPKKSRRLVNDGNFFGCIRVGICI